MEFEVTYITVCNEKKEEVNLSSQEVIEINGFLKRYDYHLALGIKA